MIEKAKMRYLPRWPIRFWLVSTIVIAVGVAAFLWLPQTPIVNAAPGEEGPLDCLKCHTRVLKGHDKLGSGVGVCWVCHDSSAMNMLRLLDGTQVSVADSPTVCSQCHPDQYRTWNYGTHGVPVARAGEEPAIPGAEKPKCVECHDAHQPQIGLADISKPHPPAGPESDTALDCLMCHVRVLRGHDKLGTGTEACWACHFNATMGVLHLASGEQVPLSDFPQLCAQCHQARYQEWQEGTHGVPAWKEEGPEGGGARKAPCIGCHNPHQPQIALLDITKPHPPPAAPAPAPSVELLIILGVSLSVIVVAGVMIGTRGEGP